MSSVSVSSLQGAPSSVRARHNQGKTQRQSQRDAFCFILVRSTHCTSKILTAEPSAPKTSSLQSLHYVRTIPHQPPQKSRAIVFDHSNDGALIESVITKRHPTFLILTCVCKSRIVTAFETVVAGHLGKLLIEIIQGRQHDFRCKRQRRKDRPGRK